MKKTPHRYRLATVLTALISTVATAGICGADDTQYLAQDAWQPGENVETWNQGFIENKSWVRNDSSPAQISMLDFSGRLRLADSGQYSPTVAYKSLYIGLGASTALLPRQLNDQAVSIGTPLGQFGQWGVSIALGSGYAGNSPFNDPDAVYGMARITVQHDLWKNTELNMAIDYNGNRQFMPDVPLPAVEIQHDQRNFHWMVGFPANSLRWQVLPRFWFNLNYYPIDSGAVEADYSLLRRLTAYTGFYSDSWAFHVSSYPSDQRLFMSQCRVQAGFKIFTLGRHLSIDIGGGYAFNQTFSQGFDARNQQPITQIANAAYAAVNLVGKF